MARGYDPHQEEVFRPMSKVLIIEDDEALADAVKEWLTDENHTVDIIGSGTEAVEHLRFYSYDFLIIDWGLPGMSGVDVLRKFRAAGGITPAIMLTGKRELDEKEEGLDAGADDYLTKPFHPRELSARMRAVLRRPRDIGSDVLKFGDLVLDAKAGRVYKAGNEVSLQPREFSLLEFLMRHPHETFSSEALLDRVWSAESEASPDAVRVIVTRLRNKIDTEGQESFIRTAHRVGYSFVPPRE